MKKIVFVLIIMFVFLIDVKAISVTVNISDSENKERLEATLIGGRIELYKNYAMVDSKVIDESGVVVFENLKNGHYGIKHNYEKGYKQDIDTYEFYIYDGSKDIVINLKSHVIEGNLIINKYVGDFIDEEAVFDVYHNNNLIKTLKYENGSIKGTLEYGTYLVKQVSGAKYYEYVDDFNVTIGYTKDYKFDLYSDMESELKLFFEKQENNLSIKENELLTKENDLNIIKDNLNKKEIELLNKEELLKQKEVELENLRNNIELKDKEIEAEKIILGKKEEELIQKEKELILLKNDLNMNKEELINLENSIIKEKEEITILKESLTKKINELEEEKLNLKIKEDEVLVVKVPNTYKRNYKKYISISLIVIGSILIIYKIKKLLI